MCSPQCTPSVCLPPSQPAVTHLSAACRFHPFGYAGAGGLDMILNAKAARAMGLGPGSTPTHIKARGLCAAFPWCRVANCLLASVGQPPSPHPTHHA